MKLNTFKLLSLGERYLTKRDVASPRVNSEKLLQHVLCREKRSDLYLRHNIDTFSRQNIKGYFSLLRKRGDGYPLQYITRRVDFLDCNLKVHEGVFIPRPETELLVLEALKRLGGENVRTVLDIGTGSGNIAISLAYYLPQVEVLAVDVSDKALALARDNAVSNGVYERIEFLKSDGFSNISNDRKFDLIISNPPYIASCELYSLDKEIHAEPVEALSDGYDGLSFYRKIIYNAAPFLSKRGLIAFEIGSNQAAAVWDILEENGFVDIEVYKDYCGFDRVIIAERG